MSVDYHCPMKGQCTLLAKLYSFIIIYYHLFIYLLIFDHMFRRLHCCTSPNCDGHPNTRNFAFPKAQAVRWRAGFEVSSVGALQRTWAELNKSFACLPTYPSTHPPTHPSIHPWVLWCQNIGASASGLLRIGLARFLVATSVSGHSGLHGLSRCTLFPSLIQI